MKLRMMYGVFVLMFFLVFVLFQSEGISQIIKIIIIFFLTIMMASLIYVRHKLLIEDKLQYETTQYFTMYQKSYKTILNNPMERFQYQTYQALLNAFCDHGELLADIKLMKTKDMPLVLLHQSGVYFIQLFNKKALTKNIFHTKCDYFRNRQNDETNAIESTYPTLNEKNIPYSLTWLKPENANIRTMYDIMCINDFILRLKKRERKLNRQTIDFLYDMFKAQSSM